MGITVIFLPPNFSVSYTRAYGYERVRFAYTHQLTATVSSPTFRRKAEFANAASKSSIENALRVGHRNGVYFMPLMLANRSISS